MLKVISRLSEEKRKSPDSAVGSTTIQGTWD